MLVSEVSASHPSASQYVNVHAEHEVEQFEDDPLEYVRVDLSFASTSGTGGSAGGLTAEGTTRRQAAADVLRALVSNGYDASTTTVVGRRIALGLDAYRSNPSAEDAWKSKDSSIFLMTAVATRGATAQHGVTVTNPLVDVVDFFSQHVFQDLQAGSAHPILQADAIRFLYSFRNQVRARHLFFICPYDRRLTLPGNPQLTKEQLISVLPLLLQHLGSSHYVCYLYAATTIERILFIKRESQPL